MPLTVAERKQRMPHGAQQNVAARLSVADSYVSAVMAGEVFPKTKRTRTKLRRVQVALAREIGVAVDEAFPVAGQAVAA